MRKIFGTDGARGIANRDITPELALKIGVAVGKIFSGNGPILIGEDTRLSSEMLRTAIASGVVSSSTDVTIGLILPTPAVSLLVKNSKNFSAGIVISASHNPIEFNGIKIFDRSGFKLSDEKEEDIENSLDEVMERSPTNIGKIFFDTSIPDFYVDYLTKRFSLKLNKLNIAVDVAHGATYYTTPATLKNLGANTLVINEEPDGHKINVECGSTNSSVISKFVKSNRVDLGVAHDGDGDRVIFSDENGNIVDGDEVMVVLGKNLKKKGLLRNNTVVGTVMTNIGIEKVFENEGIKYIRAPVGDRYVLQKMLKSGAILGGEQSGHIINLLESATGDGLITALSVIRVMLEEEKTLSELTKGLEKFPQTLVNATVKNKHIIEEMSFKEFVRSLEKELKEGRIVIRPSGTEPVIRIMVEGTDEAKIKDVAERIKEYLEV